PLSGQRILHVRPDPSIFRASGATPSSTALICQPLDLPRGAPELPPRPDRFDGGAAPGRAGPVEGEVAPPGGGVVEPRPEGRGEPFGLCSPSLRFEVETGATSPSARVMRRLMSRRTFGGPGAYSTSSMKDRMMKRPIPPSGSVSRSGSSTPS